MTSHQEVPRPRRLKAKLWGQLRRGSAQKGYPEAGGLFGGCTVPSEMVLYFWTFRWGISQGTFLARHREHGFWSSHLALDAAQLVQASTARSVRRIMGRPVPSFSLSWVDSWRARRSLRWSPRQLASAGKGAFKHTKKGATYARLNLLGQREHW